MANSLHNIIDLMKSNRLATAADVPDELIALLHETAYEQLPASMCFDIGEIAQLTGIKPDIELIKLPFDSCWFEGYTESVGQIVRCGCLCFGLHENGIGFDCIIFIKPTGREWLLLGAGAFIGEDQDHWVSAPSNNKDISDLKSSMIYACLKFISAINCSNVIKIEHQPDRKLQKAREKKNKTPIFSYWTLHLNIPKTSSKKDSLGGTHASPRLHLRHGHVRKLASGKSIYINWMWVGKSEHGMVYKDYQAKYTDKEPDH